MWLRGMFFAFPSRLLLGNPRVGALDDGGVSPAQTTLGSEAVGLMRVGRPDRKATHLVIGYPPNVFHRKTPK